mgnify:CR=1 FL=1
MGLSVAAYTAQLQALLPPGHAFTRAPDAVLTKLLQGWAEEFARIDARIDVLIAEIDPSRTTEMIDDFEDMTGLPDSCIGTLEALDKRRNAVLGRMRAAGGQDRQYFIDLAARVGYTVTITEPSLHTWQVNAPSENVQLARAGTAVAGDPLRLWGTEAILECTIARYAPAHAVLLFNYE